MKKTVKRMYHNIINRVSVLMTVFSVLVCSCFYNPASLAATSCPFSLCSNSFWWVSSSAGYSEFISGSSLYGVTSASYQYSTNSSGNSANLVTFDCIVPFVLRLDSVSSYPCYVNGTISIAYFIDNNLSADFYCGTSSFDGSILPDGTTVSCGVSLTGFDLKGNSSIYRWINVSLNDVYFPNSGSRLIYIYLHMPLSRVVYAGSYVQRVSIPIRFSVSNWSGSVSYGYKPGSGKDIVDGYDTSAGSSAQSALDTSLSGADQQSTSLFTSASSTLSGFSFTDISAFSAVASGLSFVSSTMTSVYEALGGVNGAGIVLSVGCSVLFVSFVIGAYKFYSGKKGG